MKLRRLLFRTWVWLTLLAFLPHPAAAQPQAGEKFNVLLIIADDLNTALSGYGHPQCQTPQLDRLAARGVSFTRAYSQFPLCGPSRASIMTGQYPLANGVRSNSGTVKENAMTLPRLFRENGYWTGRVSKIYHMGVPGNIFTGDHGSDHPASWVERFNVSAMETLSPGKAEDVMLADSTPFYPALREKWATQRDQGGRFLIPEGNHQGSDFVVVEAEGGDEAMADGMAATRAVELLEKLATQEQPFFLAVGFVRPHVPLVAPAAFFEPYPVEGMRLAEVPEGDLRNLPEAALANSNARHYKLDEEDQRKVLRGYYASVSYMDAQVGRLLEALERLKLTERTIVVFASDHGFHLGEHTLWQKNSLLEESIRVPLIVSAPGGFARGQRSERVVELLDLYPTLAELAGLTPPAEIQGVSFAPLLRDPAGPPVRTDAISQVASDFVLRTPGWAYLRYAGKGEGEAQTLLFDMEKDPRQHTNLSGTPGAAEVEARLRARLEARIQAAEEIGRAEGAGAALLPEEH